ncbi:MAG: hypothetical protein AAF549_02355 [Pseudomonadota bacterium]
MAQPTHDEYIIYGYSSYSPGKIGKNKWEYLGKLDDPRSCMEEANHLLKADLYDRIEVKKKSKHPENGKTLLKTYEVLGTKPKKDYSLILSCIVLIAAIVTAIFAGAF